MQRRLIVLGPLASALAGAAALLPAEMRAQAQPVPGELQAEWPGAVPSGPQGATRMRWFGLTIYDIALWAPAPVSEPAGLPAQPLALTLTYRRALDGARIAERSLDEMRRGGPIPEATAQRWLQAMQTLFPDVVDGDRITGVLRPGSGARFHHNGRLLGDWPEPDAAARFFGIWLAPWTSEPALRRALLGRPG